MISKSVRAESFAISAAEMLGEEDYRRITRDKEIVSVRRKLRFKVLYLDSRRCMMCADYEFPAHLLNIDRWVDMLVNTFCAETEGCECVVGALSAALDLQWHKAAVKAVADNI